MNFIKRLLISIVFIPLLLWIYYSGGKVLIGFLSILTVLSSYEIIRMYEKKGIKILFFNTILALSLFYCIVKELPFALVLLFLTILFNGARDVFLNKLEGASQRISGAMFSVVYPALGFGYLYRLSDFNDRLILILAVLLWLTDSVAYFIGMSLGKHRGFFKCSPKKSIEGFVAGMAFAFIGSIVIWLLFSEIFLFKHVIFFGISVGIFGQFGDLFESVLKRDLDVKDSSNIIPGHGGVLDRFDSLLFAAPVLYILLVVFS